MASSKKINVYYYESEKDFLNDQSTALFFSRAIRIMPDGMAGVNVSGLVYRIYEGGYYRPLEDKSFAIRVTECPMMSQEDAELILSKLPKYPNNDLKRQSLSSSEISSSQKNFPNTKENTELHQIDNFKKKILKDTVQEYFVECPIFENHSSIEEYKPFAYEEDWFISRSNYYTYVSFNDIELYKVAQEILSKPREYCALIAWPGYLENSFDQNKIIRNIMNNNLRKTWKDNRFGGSGFHHGQYDGYKGFEYFSNNFIFNKLVIDPRNAIDETFSFYQIFGEYDFEGRTSTQNSYNGRFYEYWIRFNLEIEDEVIREQFEEILKIYALMNDHNLSIDDFSTQKLSGFEAFSTLSLMKIHGDDPDLLIPHTHYQLDEFGEILLEIQDLGEGWAWNYELKIYESAYEREEKGPPEDYWKEEIVYSGNENNLKPKALDIVEKKASDNVEKIDEDEELRDLMNKENKELREKVIFLEKEREKRASLDRQTQKFFEKIILEWSYLYKDFYFLKTRSLKNLEKSFTEHKFISAILKSIDNGEEIKNYKSVRGLKTWHEVSKISNGTDDQGRLYVCHKIEGRYNHAILIGSKKSQIKDIEYLGKNDPPKELD